MKKALSLLLILCLLALSAMPALAEDVQPEAAEAAAVEEVPDEAAMEAPIAPCAAPADDLAVTRHSAVIQGQSIDYTATAGTMVVNSNGEDCEVFFVAYTRDGAGDPTSRPLTFAFNGGPGAASCMLHLMCMGPRRMELNEDGHASQLPAKLIDNENSLLDITDLVFIDAPGTGYSRGVNDESSFTGFFNDIALFGDFIRLYVARNERWSSPLYVAGESYGTTRAVGVCDYLASDYGIGLNGLMLISSVNDFIAQLYDVGNELPYVSFLPSMAADAWYHGCVAAQYGNMVLETFLDEVRAFAGGEYLSALFRGRSLPDDEKESVAQRMAGYLGLDAEYILKKNLRLTMEDFATTLLEDQDLMVGRYDGRYTGPYFEGSFYASDNDPSTFDIKQPLVGLTNQYISGELNYKTDEPYIFTNDEVASQFGFVTYQGFLSEEDIIHDFMSANSRLRIWVLCGYFDGATPFFGAEWVYNHVFLSEDRADNLSFTYYPAGHMLYLDPASFDKFRQDAEAWYQK